MDIANKSWTKCPKCEKMQFEMVEDYPTNSRYKMYYIRCSSCKTFLQAVPWEDTNTLINDIKTFLKIK